MQKEPKIIIVSNECAADGCYNKRLTKAAMCSKHEDMYQKGTRFKAFYGKTILKKEFQSIIPSIES